MTMKNIIITYSNGDTEKTQIDVSNGNLMLRETIGSSFNLAWTHKNADGDYTRILNMAHVRSIEILDDEEPGID